ncbi:unnamed protein product, partial [Brassica rapa subsp. trilocularis]
TTNIESKREDIHRERLERRRSMVLPGEGDRKHERPTKKALHNFRFPHLNWGTQQTMRCVKVEEPHGGSGGEEGIEEFREKMMSDIRTVRESIFRQHKEEEEDTKEKDEAEQPKKETETEREVSPPEETAEVKRWNLRKRRGDCEDSFIGLGFGFVEEEKVNTSIRCKFILSLTKKEVEDDMIKMGKAPLRRPKKRPKALQKKINLLHPGFYFSEEVTEDIYHVSDAAEKGKAFQFPWYTSSSSIILRADKTHMMSNLHMSCRYSIIIQQTVKNK